MQYMVNESLEYLIMSCQSLIAICDQVGHELVLSIVWQEWSDWLSMLFGVGTGSSLLRKFIQSVLIYINLEICKRRNALIFECRSSIPAQVAKVTIMTFEEIQLSKGECTIPPLIQLQNFSELTGLVFEPLMPRLDHGSFPLMVSLNLIFTDLFMETRQVLGLWCKMIFGPQQELSLYQQPMCHCQKRRFNDYGRHLVGFQIIPRQRIVLEGDESDLESNSHSYFVTLICWIIFLHKFVFNILGERPIYVQTMYVMKVLYWRLKLSGMKIFLIDL